MTDDEMSRLLSSIRSRVLLVLDSCFSGGFSKDVISSPRRMGLFSSEEDVTSGVADKFRAGGYLAKFMSEAVGDRRADKDKQRRHHGDRAEPVPPRALPLGRQVFEQR